MSTSNAQSDQALADRIARRETGAVAEFQRRYSQPLDRGFESMSRGLSQAHPPGCRQPMEPLVPHVAGAAGEGFLKLHGDDHAGLDSHIPALALPDLFHVSACLKHDDAACLRLVELVDREIAVPLVRRFRQRLSPGRAQEIVDDVLSQTWSKSGSPSADAGDAPPAPRIRLERYLGLSTLKTWLYTLAHRMLLDEVRRVTSAGGPLPSLDMESSSMFPVSKEPLPPDEAATIEIVGRLKPKLQQCLHTALESLRQRANPRLSHVAYLWLCCRSQQVDIARWTGVTKARVSQQAREITDLMLESAAPACRELADLTDRSLEAVNQDLKDHLREFFPPALFHRLLAAFRTLRDEQPTLLQLAYLTWHQHRDPRNIAGQICDSESRVLYLMRQLDAWKAGTQARIAAELHAESGVPQDLLEQRVERALENERDAVEQSLGSRLSLAAG